MLLHNVRKTEPGGRGGGGGSSRGGEWTRVSDVLHATCNVQRRFRLEGTLGNALTARMGLNGDLSSSPSAKGPCRAFTVETSGLLFARLGIEAAVASKSSSLSFPLARPRFFVSSAHVRWRPALRGGRPATAPP